MEEPYGRFFFKNEEAREASESECNEEEKRESLSLPLYAPVLFRPPIARCKAISDLTLLRCCVTDKRSQAQKKAGKRIVSAQS